MADLFLTRIPCSHDKAPLLCLSQKSHYRRTFAGCEGWLCRTRAAINTNEDVAIFNYPLSPAGRRSPAQIPRQKKRKIGQFTLISVPVTVPGETQYHYLHVNNICSICV